jgi:hypothetical protein
MNTIKTNVAVPERELSDAELAGVAGGADPRTSTHAYRTCSPSEQQEVSNNYFSLSPSEKAKLRSA